MRTLLAFLLSFTLIGCNVSILSNRRPVDPRGFGGVVVVEPPDGRPSVNHVKYEDLIANAFLIVSGPKVPSNFKVTNGLRLESFGLVPGLSFRLTADAAIPVELPYGVKRVDLRLVGVDGPPMSTLEDALACSRCGFYNLGAKDGVEVTANWKIDLLSLQPAALQRGALFLFDEVQGKRQLSIAYLRFGFSGTGGAPALSYLPAEGVQENAGETYNPDGSPTKLSSFLGAANGIVRSPLGPVGALLHPRIDAFVSLPTSYPELNSYAKLKVRAQALAEKASCSAPFVYQPTPWGSDFSGALFTPGPPAAWATPVESIAQSLTYEMDRPAAGWDSLRVSIEESQSVSGLLFSLRSHAFPEGEGTDCISLRLNALSAELAP